MSVVSYMFRTSWVHPQGESCKSGMVRFTCIGVNSLVERGMCSRPEHTAYTTVSLR
jgi:hypothetical protein